MAKKVLFLFLVILVLMWVLTGCAKKEEKAEQEATQVAQQAPEEVEEIAVELPEAVAQVVKEKFPEAQIAEVETEEKAGLTLYDIEFKDNKGELEVTAEGQIIEIATIITLEELPEGAAQAIQKAAEGATIKRVEKEEVLAKINEAGEITKVDPPQVLFEAELVKEGQTGEIVVTADGKIVEELKWEAEEETEKEVKEEKEEK
jgi:hypothetical protein